MSQDILVIQIQMQAQIQNQAQQQNLQMVNAAEFASKFQGKREIYRFLGSECGLYLPTYETVTIFHLKDMAANRRKVFKRTEVKMLNVPLFENLAVKDILEFAGQFPEVLQALPAVKRETEKLQRSYICNIVYSVLGSVFS